MFRGHVQITMAHSVRTVRIIPYKRLVFGNLLTFLIQVSTQFKNSSLPLLDSRQLGSLPEITPESFRTREEGVSLRLFSSDNLSPPSSIIKRDSKTCSARACSAGDDDVLDGRKNKPVRKKRLRRAPRQVRVRPNFIHFRSAPLLWLKLRLFNNPST